MIKNIWKPIGQLYFNVFLNPLKFNGTLVIYGINEKWLISFYEKKIKKNVFLFVSKNIFISLRRINS